VKRRLSPTVLLIFLAAAVFLENSAGMMLGPLLVALADEFHTSVAVAGQLAAATAVTGALTALLAGPLSDRYGRRLMLLLGLLLLALGSLTSALAWDYRVLLACRLLTGVGVVMITPNGLALVADHFPPQRRGKASGWIISANGVGAALGGPLVALLAAAGGWRLPFAVLGGCLLLLAVLVWRWFPGSQGGEVMSYLAHLRAVGAKPRLWWLLAANCLQVIAFMSMFTYLAAYLMDRFALPLGATALPLMLAGLGFAVAGLLGGRVAGHPQRLTVVAFAYVAGGLVAALLFTMPLSPWFSVALACGVATLLLLAWPVTAVLLTDLAGSSKATATGLFAVSNQLGILGGATLGGLMLAWGGFPVLGFFCLATAVLAAVVIRIAVQEPARTAPAGGLVEEAVIHGRVGPIQHLDE
jgi:DHA1 family inner membrane transport protein